METLHFLDLFQGIATLFSSKPKTLITSLLLLLLGLF